MFERLEVIRKRNDFITEELTKPEVISNVAKTTELSKEQADLSEIRQNSYPHGGNGAGKWKKSGSLLCHYKI